ncbi:hypothetical protein [Mycoplasma todarodis]|uniref:hypothetical protein n=1 Tax=Mycoplasma todarodis TaxID=1937191 RepID=UPI003B2B6E08
MVEVSQTNAKKIESVIEEITSIKTIVVTKKDSTKESFTFTDEMRKDIKKYSVALWEISTLVASKEGNKFLGQMMNAKPEELSKNPFSKTKEGKELVTQFAVLNKIASKLAKEVETLTSKAVK